MLPRPATTTLTLASSNEAPDPSARDVAPSPSVQNIAPNPSAQNEAPNPLSQAGTGPFGDGREIARSARLPPLNALRAFHVAYRCRSLRRAGEELEVTPQAVGQQIRQLEEFLGQALFIRHAGELEPSESALILAGFVQSAFSDLAEGVRRLMRPPHRSRIALNVSPYFATHFLVPTLSLSDEAAAHAEIQLSTAVHLPDLGHGGIDMAIQWGYADSWPGHETTLLLPDPKVLCCTPALAARIRTAADLRDQNLLSLVTSARLWPDLLRHLGLSDLAPAHRMGFDDAATMRRATMQGIGVGLLSEIHADEDIASGAVVAPLGRHILDDLPAEAVPGFYLIGARLHLQTPQVATFYRWLRDRDWRARPGR